jgi:sulfur relay (sulfurtransferase) DsrF/TusC family protein
MALTPQTYNDLFKVCIATSAMPNVKDAFILRDGGIAVIPKQDSVSATAATLARFCDAYPRAVLRFITRKELLSIRSVAGVARMSSTSSTPCKKIKGLS